MDSAKPERGKKEPPVPRIVCVVHPGRPGMAFCRQCRRAVCNLCLRGRLPFCSKYCLDEYRQRDSQRGPSWMAFLLFLVSVFLGMVLATYIASS